MYLYLWHMYKPSMRNENGGCKYLFSDAFQCSFFFYPLWLSFGKIWMDASMFTFYIIIVVHLAPNCTAFSVWHILEALPYLKLSLLWSFIHVARGCSWAVMTSEEEHRFRGFWFIPVIRIIWVISFNGCFCSVH